MCNANSVVYTVASKKVYTTFPMLRSVSSPIRLEFLHCVVEMQFGNLLFPFCLNSIFAFYVSVPIPRADILENGEMEQ